LRGGQQIRLELPMQRTAASRPEWEPEMNLVSANRCLFFGLLCCAGFGWSRLAPGEEPGWFDDAELIDLTHPFDEQTIFWPTERGFQLEKGPAGMTSKGYYYAANRFRSAEHGGTHLDAPIHFHKDRRTVDQIPLKQLIAKGVVIDVSAQCVVDPDYEIGIADFRRWEEKQRRQLSGEIVLLRTGFGSRWPNRKGYLGTEETGPEAVAKLHFPGLAPEAARWLTQHRSIKAVGIDTASIDHGQSKKFGSHVTLFEHNVPAFENVANLDRLPDDGSGFTVIALPMKIGGGTGAPLRIVAAVPPAAGDKKARATSPAD
jgi:kynurenine formamidase